MMLCTNGHNSGLLIVLRMKRVQIVGGVFHF